METDNNPMATPYAYPIALVADAVVLVDGLLSFVAKAGMYNSEALRLAHTQLSLSKTHSTTSDNDRIADNVLIEAAMRLLEHYAKT